MRVLLDTHMLIWMLEGYDYLVNDLEFQDLFLNKIDEIYFSPLSIWEIELKKQKKTSKFKYDAEQIYFAAIDSNYTPLPFFPKAVLQLKNVALPHRDPFDHMLLAQAIDNKLVFLTHDHLFKGISNENIYYLKLS